MSQVGEAPSPACSPTPTCSPTRQETLAAAGTCVMSEGWSEHEQQPLVDSISYH